MNNKLSLDEIAERLALPKTTVYYWIKDLPLGRPKRWSAGQERAARANKEKHRLLRERAYARGLLEYDELARQPTFRDFVTLYIAEGYKRCRNTASICNSDPVIVALGARWLGQLSARSPSISVQYHRDQDPKTLQDFWGKTLDIEPAKVRLQPKTNSGQLRGRVWRCAHGVAAATVHDTYFRARLQAWMDRLREDWL